MGGFIGEFTRSPAGLETFDYQRLMGIGTVESGFNGDFPGLSIYIHTFICIYYYLFIFIFIFIYHESTINIITTAIIQQQKN